MIPNNSTTRSLNCLLSCLAATLLAQISSAQPASPDQSQNSAPSQFFLTPPVLADPSQIIGQMDYAVVQTGADSQVWQSSTGQSVTALATGMNYWDGQQWNSSDPSFVISADGASFVASKVEDPTTLAANLNSQGAVTVSTPDGVVLSSTPTAIGLYDAASGQSVIIAALTNTIGVLVDPQHVVYTNAFVGGGLAASVVYSMPDPGSFHQDVIFTAFNPNFDPTVWGFAAASTNTLQIQIFTEFYNPPQPQVRERDLYIEQDPNVRASMASPDFIDYFMDFGHYVFGPGQAYPSSTYNLSTPGVSVAKEMVTSSGRTFMVETIRFRDLVGQLQTLPPLTVKTSSLKRLPGARRMKVAAADLPQLQPNKSRLSDKIMKGKTIALNSIKPNGVDIDYFVELSSLTQPTLYTSDTTYFVTNNVYLASPVTMESAVFKFTTNTSAGAIFIQDTLTLTTTNYRPAIFTGADDNTAGSPLNTNIWSGYTGVLGTKLYGATALSFSTISNITLNNLRFINQNLAINGVAGTAGWSLNVSHSQFVGGHEGIAFSAGGSGDSVLFNANNCLFAAVQYPFLAASVGLTGNVCYCTIDQTSSLTYMTSISGGILNFTNSILTGVGYGLTNGVTLGGGNNGFWGTAIFGSPSYTSTTSPYQWTWAGFYYLTNTTTFTSVAETNINLTLLNQIRTKTTQIPMTLSSPQFTANTTLLPVVPRDTLGLALGFHYDPIDYIGACAVSNATLALSNGVVLAYYDNCLTWLQDGSTLISQGTPNQRNYIVYYNAVQEQPLSYYGVTNFMAQLLPFVPLPVGSSALPSIDLRLTTICAPTGESNIWISSDYGGNNVINSLTLQDCEVYGSGANWQMSESANSPTVGFTNNVFYRVPFAVNSNAKITSFNNLFYGTTNANEFTNMIVYRNGAPSPNTHENDVFDGVKATLDGTVGYNAYVNGATNTSFTNNHDIITNFTWQGGPLGYYYQMVGSPLLTNGSRSAANLGLYHYTVLTNETIDSSNAVSRGYHYVAVTNTTGLPLDYNNDGFPDYLADANGDGTNNNGEIQWMNNTAPWIAIPPTDQYVSAGRPAIFSVLAYGTAPLSYDWRSNTVSITGATSSVYSIASAETNDVTGYEVTVSNAISTATSSPFVYLSIVYPPQILSNSPATNGVYWMQTNIEKLSAVVTNPAFMNSGPSGYFWQFDGTNVPNTSYGGASATYTPFVEGGTNTVIFTNVAGTANVTWTNIVFANPGMVETWGANGSGECNRPAWLTNAAAIAAGEYQSIAITDDGNIVQWGRYITTNDPTFYSVGDTLHATQPPTNRGVVAVAACGGHALALTSSNNIIPWGLTNSPALIIPYSMPTNNVKAIACGYDFCVELLSNGTVFAWGDNTLGQTNVPANLTNVIGIAACAWHSMALLSNGTVVSWGTEKIGPVTNEPSSLTNVVALAAGANHNLALQADGTVVAWGDLTNLPASVLQSNVLAIAAGDNHNVALLDNGTLVAWGNNTYGQINVPQFNTNYPLNVKLLAAGGNHTEVGIWSPLVQYPINVANDLLLVYNSNSLNSTTVFSYYTNNRPMIIGANSIGLGCITNEGISQSDYLSTFCAPIVGWLTNHPTKRPQYVVLFNDLPSCITNTFTKTNSVQCDIHRGINYATPWTPFVSSINMDNPGQIINCTNYINKLATFGNTYSPGKLIISAGAYGNANWYFDDGNPTPLLFPPFYTNAIPAIESVNPAASIIYSNSTSGILFGHISAGINVAGFGSWGAHGYLGATNWGYATNNTIVFSGNSGWFLIETSESYNGTQSGGAPDTPQGNYISWYATNAFGGINGSYAPVGAVCNVNEPYNYGNNPAIYFGQWAADRIFPYCAWQSATTHLLQVIGDPFIKK